MKNILVPFDFSRPAIHAFRFALDVAALSMGKVHLLNVFELGKRSRDKFGALVSRYDKGAVDIVTRAEVGDMPPAVYQFIKKAAIDIIIMGSHATKGFCEMFTGSNAEKIVLHSPVPVLTVKECCNGPIRDIVFPVDLATPNQQDFITKIKALQQFFQARLHLLRVNTPANAVNDSIAYSALQAFAAQCDLGDYTINIFDHQNGTEGIHLFAEAIRADLIAMGAQVGQRILQPVGGDVREDTASHDQHLIWTYSTKDKRVAS